MGDYFFSGMNIVFDIEIGHNDLVTNGVLLMSDRVIIAIILKMLQ